MIVYFSGTGNSRYVAKMLAQQLNDETLSATDYIKNGIAAELFSQKPWVFVCPVYVSAPPRVFMDFIKSASFNGNKKAWFIMTCAGGFGACPAYAKKLSDEKGLRYMGAAQVCMPQNYLAFFKTKEKAECDEIVRNAIPEIQKLGALIAEFRAFPDPGMKSWELISTEMIIDPYYKYFMNAKKFTVSDSCIGCGKCERVCPLGNITLTGKKPVWGDRCTHCMACINYCPVTAIEYGKKTQGKPRYHCVEFKK